MGPIIGARRFRADWDRQSLVSQTHAPAPITLSTVNVSLYARGDWIP